MKKLITFVAVAVCAASNASTWHEGWHGGDAGDLPGTAQVTQGSAGLTQILGDCTGGSIDMYKINIVNAATFQASTVGTGSGDIQLYLFDTSGVGVAFNDDLSAGDLSAQMDSLGTATITTGQFYLAVCRYNHKPRNAAALDMWTLTPFTGTRPPDGPGAPGPVTQWGASTTGSAYTVNLTGISPSIIGADEVDPFFISVTLDTPIVYGGGGTTGHVNFSSPVPAGGVTISLSSSSGAVTVPASVFVAATLTTETFAVTSSSVGASTPAVITGTYAATSTSRTANITVEPIPANSWIEMHSLFGASAQHGDAGQTIGTAQMTIGNSALNTIFGNMTAGGDPDIYCIRIVDPATFSLSTVNADTANGVVDTQVFLFHASGIGIAMDDDDPVGTTLQSNIPAGDPLITVLAPGTYYLAVSTFDQDPVDTTPNELWLDLPYDVVRAPDGPGAANPMDAWNGTTARVGNYRIDMTGAGYCMPAEVTVAPTSLVPGPGSILGGGIAEASASDNARVNMRPGAILVATAFPLVLQAVGTAPAATASSLKVQIETRATVANVRQIVEARNFAAGPNVWDVLEDFTGLPSGANPDRAVTFTLASPNNYIGPSNEIRVRIRCRNTTAVLVYPWQTQFDEVTWRFTP